MYMQNSSAGFYIVLAGVSLALDTGVNNIKAF
jgi:hypothetical protein